MANSIASCNARSAIPTLILETAARSRSRPLITTRCPSCSAPTMLATGTIMSSNTNSAVCDPRKPILTSFWATWNPGVAVSTTNAVMPLEPLSGRLLA